MKVSDLKDHGDDDVIDIYNSWAFGWLERGVAISLLQDYPGSWALWRIWMRSPV